MADVPGIKSVHCLITDVCRRVQGGDTEAFDEAVRRIREEYDYLTREFHPRGKGVKFHLVFSVEFSPKDGHGGP